MATILRLTVVTGPHRNEKFCFCGPMRCSIGRAADCFIQLVGEQRDSFISRRHCELILAPPFLTVKDLASQNGTFVNGLRIESIDMALPSQKDSDEHGTAPVLNQGDLLTIGGTTFRMDLVECPSADATPTDAPCWEDGEKIRKGCPVQCL